MQKSSVSMQKRSTPCTQAVLLLRICFKQWWMEAKLPNYTDGK